MNLSILLSACLSSSQEVSLVCSACSGSPAASLPLQKLCSSPVRVLLRMLCMLWFPISPITSFGYFLTGRLSSSQEVVFIACPCSPEDVLRAPVFRFSNHFVWLPFLRWVFLLPEIWFCMISFTLIRLICIQSLL